VGRAGHTPARRVLAVAAVVAGSALALDACGGGQNGQALAQQACVHVDRSVRDYLLSTRPGTAPATAAQLQAKADSELRLALPLAAAANSADGSWNALMTTISEGATVDEQHLVPSLRAQCVVANTNPNVNPQSPGSTTPQNVNPEPASAGG
jgi:hypothetical protein